MMPTVVTWLGMQSRLKKPSNATATTPSSLNNNPPMQSSATSPWGETDAGRRLAFVFTVFVSHQPIPKFASEEEEAAWWDAHPEVLAERFQTARQQGQVRRLSQTDLPGAAETVTIRIPQQELARARALAAKRGLRYQRYLKMLLHEALDADEKKLAS